VTALAELLPGHGDRIVLLEVHGLEAEPSEAAAEALADALER
jgi:hypothetical protein